MKQPLNLTPYQQQLMRRTAIFGYVLFALVVISAVLSFVSLALSVQGSRGASPQLRNLFLFIGISPLASLLPPLIAYFVGERGTKTRSPHEHHNNGVLIALLAATLGVTLSSLPYSFYIPLYTALGIYSQLPGPLLALAIVAGLVYWYMHTKKRVLLTHFLPFQLVVIVATLLPLLMSVVSITSSVNASDLTPLAIAAALTLAIGLLIWAGMRASRDTTLLAKLTDSLIAAMVGSWMMSLVSLLAYSFRIVTFINVVPVVAGVLTWAIYLYYLHMRTGARKNK